MNEIQSAKQKYYSHRNRAKRANIEWQLTFDEWYNWWQQTGHWNDRGRAGHNYHMCRYNDIGPYALHNIYCDTNSNNVGYANKVNPKKGYKHKATTRANCRAINLHRAKPVRVNGIEYFGIREAARQLNICRELLRYRLKRKLPGYEWV